MRSPHPTEPIEPIVNMDRSVISELVKRETKTGTKFGVFTFNTCEETSFLNKKCVHMEQL